MIPSTTLSLVPLDDRPCNRLFPAQLAPTAGWEVSLPPRESLGWFTRPGDCEAISDWLRKAPSGRLVVSTDMLCYGGLIASRSPAVGLEQAMGRLETLGLSGSRWTTPQRRAPMLCPSSRTTRCATA